jgi:hypothetical protein
MKNTLLFLIGINLLFYNKLEAQMSFTPQYLNRAEMRHGYSTLADTNQKASVFISQRVRLGAIYSHEKFKINMAVQDVRTWGSVANAAIDTKGLLSVYEANVDLYFTKKITAKIGRQAIGYDDERIFGCADWGMQGRRHDAFLLKYKDSTLSLHTGVAYNQTGESNKYINYYITGNYQNFQYLWANKVHEKYNFSFLFLNNGTVKGSGDSSIVYSQTIGLRSEYKSDKFNWLAYGYYQMGELSTHTLNAYDLCAEVAYKPFEGFLTTIGTELLSGTSQTNATSNKNNSFNPLYGTNHKFNGYLDYFYVGNHANSVGLLDGFAKVSYTKNKLLYSLNYHYFRASNDVKDKTVLTEVKALDRNLGGEIDFTLSYNYTDGISIQAGYSQFFGTKTLQSLRGGNTTAYSNYAYVMLIVRPGGVKFPTIGLKM